MNVERVLLEEFDQVTINIGYQGEKNHTKVVISCPVMFRDHPDAVASMVVKPPQGDLYPVSLTRSGNDLIWDVSEGDVANSGSGTLQLTFTDGEGDDAEVIKTVFSAYSVNASLMANGEAPDPVQSWLDEAGAALATFETEVGEIRKITTATAEDEGKALSPKTVVNGKVTEWEYIDTADPEAIQEAVDNWLDDHPEATTTVEDGAITETKLNDSLKADLAWKDDVDGLMSAITQEKAPVILDTASGEIVTVPDGADGMLVEQMVVAIEPVQDLHGQSNPYPAGGGKNIIPMTVSNIKAMNTDGTWNDNVYTYRGVTYTLNTDDGGNVESITVNGTAAYISNLKLAQNIGASLTVDSQYALSGCASGGANDGYNLVIGVTPDTTRVAVDTGSGASFTYQSAYTSSTYNVYIAVYRNVSISTKTFAPMLRLSSASSDFAPYSNLCPISGWSAAEVVRTGFNQWDEEWELGGISNQNGTTFPASDRIRCKNYIPCLPNTGYWFNTPSYPATIAYYDAEKNCISAFQPASSIVRTTPENARFIKFSMQSTYGTTYHNDICINISDPSKNGQYEPYHAAQTKTYPFPTPPGTVYGGTLTVNSDGTGKLVVNRGIVDLGVPEWGSATENGRAASAAISDIKPITSSSSTSGIICSAYKEITARAWYNNDSPGVAVCGMGYGGDKCIGIVDTSLANMSSAQVKQAMSGVQLVYELATTVVYNLTALEVIELLKGTNNIWADCGDSSIEYPCDTKLYVDKKIMEAIANALNA